MEQYTVNNLPPTTERPDDMRLSLTKSRLVFLWCAFRYHALRGASVFRTIALVLVLLLVIILPFFGHLWGALILFVTLVVRNGKFFRMLSQEYSLLREGNCFPVITSEGPRYVMSLDNGEKYVGIASPRWKDVKTITFYSNFLVIETKDNADIDCFFMWTNDMAKAKETALALWSNALKNKKNNKVQPEIYSETEMKDVSDFIEEEFGEYDYIMHEIVSPDIHVDIAIIPPDEDRDYYTLCTIGVGAHRMDVPDNLRYENQVAERLELLMYLPADWELNEKALKDEKKYWPIRLIKDFARLPIRSGSWIAWGHTMAETDNKPYADGVPYCASVLLGPETDIYEPVSLPLSTGKSVDFFQVFPITKEEIDYKIRCAEDEDSEISPTEMMIDDFGMDSDDWIDYLLDRYSYRDKKN